ncbi:MAG TPA: hypothetical protein VFF03_14645 [Rhodocyclaceae bacterium]|nr:hypothetical protein [Rhodocyclaceae bacterium]
MATLRPLANVLAIGLTLAYPFAVYFGLDTIGPRGLGLMLLAVLVLRHWQSVRRFASDIRQSEWLVFALLAGMAGAIAAFGSEVLLLLYPVAVSLSLLLVFGRSLFHPPTVIERIARLTEPNLPPEGVRYTRQVTRAWCVFFAANGAIAMATAFASREAWLLYNGLISYLLMGVMFTGEWVIRGRVRRRLAAP